MSRSNLIRFYNDGTTSSLAAASASVMESLSASAADMRRSAITRRSLVAIIFQNNEEILGSVNLHVPRGFEDSLWIQLVQFLWLNFMVCSQH